MLVNGSPDSSANFGGWAFPRRSNAYLASVPPGRDSPQLIGLFMVSTFADESCWFWERREVLHFQALMFFFERFLNLGGVQIGVWEAAASDMACCNCGRSS